MPRLAWPMGSAGLKVGAKMMSRLLSRPCGGATVNNVEPHQDVSGIIFS